MSINEATEILNLFDHPTVADYVKLFYGFDANDPEQEELYDDFIHSNSYEIKLVGDFIALQFAISSLRGMPMLCGSNIDQLRQMFREIRDELIIFMGEEDAQKINPNWHG